MGWWRAEDGGGAQRETRLSDERWRRDWTMKLDLSSWWLGTTEDFSACLPLVTQGCSFVALVEGLLGT